MRDEKYPKMSSGEILVLENSMYTTCLLDIKTSNKPEMIKRIRSELTSFMKNDNLDHMRDKKIDLSIVAYMSEKELKRRDVDNIAKTVLDAISKSRHHNGNYIFENDNKIVRLLVYKKKKEQNTDADTSEFIISFREHDPNLEMNLVQKTHI